MHINSITNNLMLSILIGLFTISSWIVLNGVWIEIPLLINYLPEGWKLPAYLVVIIQLGNISPLLYMAVYHVGKYQNLERFTIYFILIIGCISCALVSIFWDHVSNVFLFGQWHQSSIIFFILIWILSMVDTTSSVTFLPYLALYPRQYITALYFGEGLSGFLPGIIGLIQGVGDEQYCVNKTTVTNGTNHTNATLFTPPPLFSISIYFAFLCAVMLLSLISFSLVDNGSCFFKYRSEAAAFSRPESDSLNSAGDPNDSLSSEADNLFPVKTIVLPKKKIFVLIFLVGYINLLTNAVLPSIQNYSLMPYSINLYHLVVVVSQILNPMACLLTLRRWKTNSPAIAIMTILGSIGTAYIFFLAFKSPMGWLSDKIYGKILAAFCWISVIIIFSFEKALLAIEIQSQGHFWLQICGVATQIGSILGAILIFILVIVLGVFKSKEIIC